MYGAIHHRSQEKKVQYASLSFMVLYMYLSMTRFAIFYLSTTDGAIMLYLYLHISC